MENVKKNFIFQSAYQILSIIMPIIMAPYLARVIGAEGIGIYAYTYSIVYYFMLVGRLGIQNYGNREIAKVRDNKIELDRVFSELWSIHVFFSLLSIVAYGMYIYLIADANFAIEIAQGIYLIGQLLDISWLFWGLEKFNITVTRNMIVKILTTIVIFLFVKRKNDLLVYTIILATGTILSESIVWITLPRYVKFVFPKWDTMKKHIMPMLILFIPSIAVSIYKYMDKIMIGILSTNVQVGYYENSEKIINMAIGVITSLGVVTMPRMANLFNKGNTEESLSIINKSIKFIMILSIGFSCGIIGISHIFLPVFLGEEFSASILLLEALALSIPFTGFASVLRMQYLIPKHKDKVYLVSIIVAAIINIIINAVLIPIYNAFGAVMATVLAEIVVCVIQTIALRKILPIQDYLKNSVPFLVSGLIMLFCVYAVGACLGASLITLIMQIVIGILLYLLLCLCYIFFHKDELWYFLLKQIKKK